MKKLLPLLFLVGFVLVGCEQPTSSEPEEYDNIDLHGNWHTITSADEIIVFTFQEGHVVKFTYIYNSVVDVSTGAYSCTPLTLTITINDYPRKFSYEIVDNILVLTVYGTKERLICVNGDTPV